MSSLTDQFNNLRANLATLAVEARERAPEFETARALADDFAQRLKATQVSRVLIERDRGGLDGTVRDLIDMVAMLAEADGSTGWVAGHWALTAASIQALAQDPFVEEVLSTPGGAIGWSNMPRAEIEATEGGWRVSGRWAFASGCKAADWIGGDVPVPDADAPRGFRSVTMLAPAAEGRIEETWDVVGLAGSGSHTIVLENVFVPTYRTFDWPDAKPVAGRRLGFLARPWTIGVVAAGVHLGLARRAIDETRAELEGKRDRMTGEPLVARSEAVTTLEAAEGLLYALRAGLDRAADDVWAEGLQNGAPSDAARLTIRTAATTAVQEGARIVRDVWDIAGASAIRRAAPLQRVMRDASCLIHHVSGRRECWERAGRVRLGVDRMHFGI